MIEVRDAERAHAPTMESIAYNQMPKTSDHREAKLYRYEGTHIYQWWSKRDGSVFEDPFGAPFVIA